MNRPDPDDLLGRLNVWASEQRAEQAKLDREHSRREREMALDEMRLSGLLRDLYEQQIEVSVITCHGTRLAGHVTETGSDYFALGTPGFGSTLVAIDAVDTVETGRALTPSDRSIVASRTFATVLDDYCQHRVQVNLKGSAAPVKGRLEGVGHDLVVVVVDGCEERRAFVPVKNIATLAVADA